LVLLACILWSGYGNTVEAYQDRLGYLDGFLMTQEPSEAPNTPSGAEMELVQLPQRPVYDWDDREEIKRMIVDYAGLYRVDPQDALRIAQCESGFQYAIKNANSSATGLYQWTSGTWEAIESPGDRLNPHDNIRAFMRYYPTNPGWWVCK